MTETPAPDLRALREKAEAATPGPWGWGGDGVATAYFDDRSERLICIDTLESQEAFKDDPAAYIDCLRQDSANGRFIAAANPTAVLALIERVEAAEAAVERAKNTHSVAWEPKPGLEIVCSCGAHLSCYGLTTGIGGIFAKHIRDARSAEA